MCLAGLGRIGVFSTAAWVALKVVLPCAVVLWGGRGLAVCCLMLCCGLCCFIALSGKYHLGGCVLPFAVLLSWRVFCVAL